MIASDYIHNTHTAIFVNQTHWYICLPLNFYYTILTHDCRHWQGGGEPNMGKMYYNLWDVCSQMCFIYKVFFLPGETRTMWYSPGLPIYTVAETTYRVKNLLQKEKLHILHPIDRLIGISILVI